MVKITLKKECGNSPKNLFLRDFNIAFAQDDIDSLLRAVSEDVQVTIVGDQLIEGIVAFESFFKKMMGGGMKDYIISEVFTHGKSGAAHGEIIMENGDVYGFCDIYEFTSAAGKKINKITLPLNPPQRGGSFFN